MYAPTEGLRAPLAVFRGHADAVWALGMAPDGSALLSAGADGRVCLWTPVEASAAAAATAHHVPLAAWSAPGGAAVACAAWVPRLPGRVVLACVAADGADGGVYLVAAESGEVVATFAGGMDGWVGCLAHIYELL